MALVFRFRVEKIARTIPKGDWDRLIERLERIASDPYGHHHQAAKRRKDGAFQVRHGQWRALYRITPGPQQHVEVIDVGPRREVNRP